LDASGRKFQEEYEDIMVKFNAAVADRVQSTQADAAKQTQELEDECVETLRLYHTEFVDQESAAVRSAVDRTE
jgi:hypothetical protein